MSRVARLLAMLALYVIIATAATGQSTNPPVPPPPVPEPAALAPPAPPATTPAAPIPAASASPIPSLPPEVDRDSATTLAERVLLAPREPRCAPDDRAGTLTVCGKKKDNSRDRLPIPDDLDAAHAVNDGLPRAPDVMGNRITGRAIGFRSCFPGACPAALLPDINFSLLPPAPAGSDADRIAKGEIRAN